VHIELARRQAGDAVGLVALGDEFEEGLLLAGRDAVDLDRGMGKARGFIGIGLGRSRDRVDVL